MWIVFRIQCFTFESILLVFDAVFFSAFSSELPTETTIKTMISFAQFGPSNEVNNFVSVFGASHRSIEFS